jgi:hypothetical protein
MANDQIARDHRFANAKQTEGAIGPSTQRSLAALLHANIAYVTHTHHTNNAHMQSAA